MIKSYFFFVLLFSFLLISFSVESSPKFLKKCSKKCKNEKNDYEEIICLKKCSKKYFSNEKKNPISLSDESSEYISHQKIWDIYRSMIFSLSSGSKETKMQVISSPMEASWHLNSEALNFFADKNSVWGSNYEDSFRTFSKVYTDFLLNIIPNEEKVLSEDQKNQFKNLKKNYQDLTYEYKTQQLSCIKRFTKFKITGIFEDFERKNCPLAIIAKGPMEGAYEQYMIFQKKFIGDTELSNNIANVYKSKFGWIDSGELAKFYDNAKSGTIKTLSSLSTKQITEKTTWIRQNSGWFTSSLDSQKELLFHEKNFGISISGVFGEINIKPGDWFSPSMIQKYKDPSNWLNKGMNFFGEEGDLSLIKQKVHVAYNPKITLTMSIEDKSEFERILQSGFSLLFFSSSKHSKVTEISTKENKYVVEFSNDASNTDEIQIIAVENHFIDK